MADTTQRAHNIHPITYRGKPHLAFVAVVEGDQHLSKVCTNVIMDQNYNIVEEFGRTVTAGGRVNEIDPHDFTLLDKGGKIVQLTFIDHDDYDDGRHEGGPVKEAAFQVLDVETHENEFEWRSLDHVPWNETFMALNQPDY